MIKDSMENMNRQLQLWVVDVFKLPKTAIVSVVQRDSQQGKGDPATTDIVVSFNERLLHTFTIAKPLSDITHQDVKQMRATLEAHIVKKHPILGHLLRLSGWSVGFSGLYIMFAVCPFCGQPGCPVGAASAGLIGAIFAVLMQYWRAGVDFTKSLYNKLFKRNQNTGM